MFKMQKKNVTAPAQSAVQNNRFVYDSQGEYGGGFHRRLTRYANYHFIIHTHIFPLIFFSATNITHTQKKKNQMHAPAKPALLIKFKLELYEFARIFLYTYILIINKRLIEMSISIFICVLQTPSFCIFYFSIYGHCAADAVCVCVCVCHNNRIFIYPRALP